MQEDIRPSRATQEEMEEEIMPLPVPKGDIKGLAKDGLMVKMIAVSFIVTLIIILGMGALGGGSFVTKTDFDTNWANMEAKITASVAELEQLKKTVNNGVQGIPSMINSQTSTAISNATNNMTSQVNEASNKANVNTAKISDIESRLKVLEEENDDLRKIIEDWEEVKVAADEDTDALEVNMGYSSSFEFPAGQLTSGDHSIYLQVENTLDFDVKNVNVELVIHSRGVPINLAHTPTVVSGGYPLQWQKVYVGNGVCVVQGVTPSYGDGLEIEADDDASIFVTVKLAVATADIPTDNITFYVEGKVTGYDLE